LLKILKVGEVVFFTIVTIQAGISNQVEIVVAFFHFLFSNNTNYGWISKVEAK